MFKKLVKQKYSIYTVRSAYNVEEKRGAYGGFGGERDHLKKSRRRWRISERKLNRLGNHKLD